MFFKRPSVLMSKQWALVCVADDTTESSRGAGRSLSEARGTFIGRFAPADEHAAITYDLAPVAVQRNTCRHRWTIAAAPESNPTKDRGNMLKPAHAFNKIGDNK